MKILLVEDNDLNRDMLSRRLLRRGYEIVPAIDGREALDLANEISPDPILLDMSLPIVDGWEVTRRLKAAPATASIPIIALTAHLLSKELAHALRNPLAAIIGYSEILIDESDASLGDDLTAISSSAIDILELINQAVADASV